ncbi:MAG: NifU family protein [Bacteriovoracaceae bacterium]
MELSNCSNKVNERAERPKFIGTDEECNQVFEKENYFFCHFHFPNSNGEITVYGELSHEGNNQIIKEARYITNVKGAPLAFLDALVELSHKRDFHSLPLLSMKEIDSFLRDKNSQSSFEDEGVKLYRYYEVIPALTKAISKKNFLPTTVSHSEKKSSPAEDEYYPFAHLIFDREKLGAFSELETGVKIKIVNDVLSFHVSPLLQRDGGDVECVHVLDNLIVLVFHGNCGGCGMALTSTMDFIKKVLRTELFDSSIDIITDS